MEKQKMLYSGKVKSLYATTDPQKLVVVFRDDTTAFNGEKADKLARKGMVNNRFNAFIMQHLEKQGIATHFESLLSDTESLVSHLDMLPIECVVRNIATGSLCKRLGVESGLTLEEPLFEFFLKDDALGDPLITEDHIRAFGWAKSEEIGIVRAHSLRVNTLLSQLFNEAGLLLVDFKLEFGRSPTGQLILGDEFTPDGCRIWDKETRKVLDKDRFRQDMGSVVEAYEEVAQRLGVPLSETV